MNIVIMSNLLIRIKGNIPNVHILSESPTIGYFYFGLCRYIRCYDGTWIIEFPDRRIRQWIDYYNGVEDHYQQLLKYELAANVDLLMRARLLTEHLLQEVTIYIGLICVDIN